MENNELKERIRRNIKEEIAISNIRKEFGMKNNKNKKVIYAISSACAVVILVIGVFIGTGNLNDNLLQNNLIGIGKTENNNNEGTLNVELNINKLKDIGMTRLDVDIKTIEIESLPEKYKFIENVKIPEEYRLEDSYNIFVREDKNIEEYNVLHDYVFCYEKDDLNDIRISFSEKEEPVRDYYINNEKEKISKIGNVELIISKWREMYIVTFQHKNLYFDIETTGITENQLIDLLKSIIECI